MRRSIAILSVALLTVATAAPAVAETGSVETQPVVENFTPDGTPSGESIGTARLVRSSDGLRAKALLGGLTPGGVYTFWWVVIPDGGINPDDAFVTGAAYRVVGESGKARVNMQARAGQESIEGFLIPFNPLDFDLGSAEVHIEVAYHGQVGEAGADLPVWLSDFWTGTACPQAFGLNPGGTPGDVNAIGQPHCPVYITSIFPGG